MNKRHLLLAATGTAAIVLLGFFVWMLAQERQDIKDNALKQAISSANQAGMMDTTPGEIERRADIWDGLAMLNQELVTAGLKPTHESVQTLSETSATTAYKGASFHENLVQMDGCLRSDHSVVVNGKRFTLPSTFAGGNREECEKVLGLGPEVRWSFVGITYDKKEAWIVESSPFPIGDASSGEVPMGSDLLRFNLVTGKLVRWTPKDASIQRAEPQTGIVLLHGFGLWDVEEYSAYRPVSGVYTKSLLMTPKSSDLVKRSRQLENGLSGSVVQTALSSDGRYAAFTYVYPSPTIGAAAPMGLTLWDLQTGEVHDMKTGLGESDVFAISDFTDAGIKIIWRAFDAPADTSSASKNIAYDAFVAGKFTQEISLVTGTFTFKVVCDGKLYDEKVPCNSAKQLVVVRDERPTGGTLVAETVLATVNTTKDDIIVFKAFAVPGIGEGTDIVVDFRVVDSGSLGVCMSDRYSAVYDTVSPGSYKPLKNYPDYADGGVWANGVMAFVPGCASGAGYPTDAVMIYDLGKDKVMTVTEAKAVPPGLWEDKKSFPFDELSTALPYWSDLKWNDRLAAFTINLNLVDGHRIQPYVFNASGKDITSSGF